MARKAGTKALPLSGLRTWERVDGYLGAMSGHNPEHPEKTFSTNLRASKMYYMCPREEVWARIWHKTILDGKPKAKVKDAIERLWLYHSWGGPSGKLMAIFDTGSVLHWQVQYYYGLIGLLRGSWKCSWCSNIVLKADGKMPLRKGHDRKKYHMYVPAPCPKCRGKNLKEMAVPWFYVEPSMVSRKEGISGHTDGTLIIPDGTKNYRVLLEIKSINEDGFKEKYNKLPLPQHKNQTCIYMELFDHDYTLIVYFNKNRSEVKEFLVARDPEPWRAILKSTRAIHKAAKAMKPLPEKWRVCKSRQDEKARKCPACDLCFGGRAGKNFWS